MKKILFYALLLLFSGTILSQANRRVLIEQKYFLVNGKNLDSVELNIAIPKNYEGRQVINKITYSVNPKFIYMINEVSFAHFSFNARDLKKIDSILIQIDMTLIDYDLNQAKEQPQFTKLSKRKRKRYLKNTGLYELPKINE